jgi:hypothetical protein
MPFYFFVGDARPGRGGVRLRCESSVSFWKRPAVLRRNQKPRLLIRKEHFWAAYKLLFPGSDARNALAIHLHRSKAEERPHAMSDTLTPPRAPADVLSQTDFFAVLTPDQLRRVGSISQIQEHAEGVRIYNHGDPAKYFYVLAAGMVRFAIGFGNRKASAGDILRRGNVFGWAALTPGAKCRIATASCVTHCTVLAIDGDTLNDLMEQDTALGFQLMKQLNLLVTGTLTAFAAG